MAQPITPTMMIAIETLAVALYADECRAGTAPVAPNTRYAALSTEWRNHWRKIAHTMVTELHAEADKGLFIKP